jgi:hypothetical protein
MPLATHGAIDCDLHPVLPGCRTLLPFLDDHWRAEIEGRGIDRLDLALWPRNAPITARADWRPAGGLAGGDVVQLGEQVLDPLGLELGILNPLFGAPCLHNADLAAALCRAANDWVAREWLDRDGRLRAGMLVPVENAELAADEIERRAADRRFVQVLLPGSAETLLGRRVNWPIFAAAERHDLPVALQLASATRFAPTTNGWPTYLIEDHVNFALTFQAQVLSMIAEGVFTRHPRLKLVLCGAGIGWVPSFLWRATKEWRALRREIPWVDRDPADIFRDHVRITCQPLDVPDAPDDLALLIEMIGTDAMLLFATDWPHWRFDGLDALPPGLPEGQRRAMLRDSALATYSRLGELVA